MERRPQVGDFYRHFKNKLYQIVAVAIHSETGEELVIYQALYDTFKVYARPLSMFVSEVDHEKYPEVTQKYRFERVTLEGATPTSVTVEEALTEESTEEPSKLMAFLDASSMKDKLAVLTSMHGYVTDSMIETMAVSLDVVIEDGPIIKRYDELRKVLLTRQQYEEANRLW